MLMSGVNQRCFFGNSNDTSQKDKENTEDVAEKDAEKEDTKNQSSESSTSASSSDEGEVDLTKEDIDKIKKLITEQDETIEKHEKELEEL